MQPDLTYAMHPLHADEKATIEAMNASVTVLPTHCINTESEFEGFRVTLQPSQPATAIPVNRYMFHGHSLFECGNSACDLINADVVRLMGQDNKGIMSDLMRDIDERSKGHEAHFDCAPDNTDIVTSMSAGLTKVSYAQGKRAVDSCKWQPELPASIGLYHAMVRGYQKDTRQHKVGVYSITMVLTSSNSLRNCLLKQSTAISSMPSCM